MRLKIEKGARADDVETGDLVEDVDAKGLWAGSDGFAQVLTRLDAIEQKMDRILKKLENAASKGKEEAEGTLSCPEIEVDELESSEHEGESQPKRKRTSSEPLWSP